MISKIKRNAKNIYQKAGAAYNSIASTGKNVKNKLKSGYAKAKPLL